MDHIGLSVKEAAKIAGVSRSLLYTKLMAGELPSVRVNNRRLVLRHHLLAWLERQAGGDVPGESTARSA